MAGRTATSLFDNPTTPPKTQTAYDQWGNPVSTSMPVQQWQPNTGYAGTNYFEAPPPQDIVRAQMPTTQFPSLDALGGTTAPRAQTTRPSIAQTPSWQPPQQPVQPPAIPQTPAKVEYEAVSGEQEKVAREAAFGRAKEQAGLNARASLMSLQNVVDDRGLTGSSIEAAEQGRAIGGAQSEMGQFINEQLVQDLDRAEEIANLKFQGGITQRGQNMGRNNALIALLDSGGLY